MIAVTEACLPFAVKYCVIFVLLVMIIDVILNGKLTIQFEFEANGFHYID